MLFLTSVEKSFVILIKCCLHTGHAPERVSDKQVLIPPRVDGD